MAQEMPELGYVISEANKRVLRTLIRSALG